MKVQTKISTRCDLETYVCKAIDSAKYTIDIICFEVSSERVIEKIRKKGCEGIQVYIHCEKRKASAELLTLGKDNENVKIELSEPNKYYYALHEKFLLIDEKKLIFGTFNLSEISLKKNIEILFDTNNFSFVEKFLNHLDQLSEHKSSKFISPAKANQIGIDCTNQSGLFFSNECDLFDIVSKYLNGAHSRITVYASHRISNKVYSLLINAIDGGIKVNIVKDFSTIGSSFLDYKLRKYTHFVNIDGKMHIKAILIDEDTFLVGSLNLFERSLFDDQEFLFIGNDKKINANIRSALNDVKNISKPYVIKYYTKYLINILGKIYKKLKSVNHYTINKYYN